MGAIEVVQVAKRLKTDISLKVFSPPLSTFWGIRKEKPHLFSSGLFRIPSIPLKNSKAIWNS